VFERLSPSAVDTPLPYIHSLNGIIAGSADYITTSANSNFVTCGATTGTVSVPTTADTIAIQ
jgi:hypothetical protein